MVGEFTDQQVGKRVVTQDGVEVGRIDHVRDGDLYVEVTNEPDLDTLEELGWDDVVNLDSYHLKGEFVSMITDDAVRLRL